MTAAAPIGVDLLTHLPRLQLRFSSSASLVAMDADDDPATLEWSCKAVLPVWEPMDDEEVTEGERLLSPDVSLSRSQRDDGEELTIFRMSGLTLDLWRIHRIYDSLDSRSSDYEHFARLFDSSGDMGLHAEFEECLIGGTHVVLIDRARLAPAWRGLGGVGRLLIGRLLRWTTDSAALVATHPFPIDIPVDERDDKARLARETSVVQKTWQSLGFEPFHDDLWVMQPHLRPHGDAVQRLENTLLAN
ncbi:hypothetical protein ACFRAA_10075 [[Kitasatospora] papulosa]|uniref:hypothetical protein n=1 Tax=[Kitasatospora] papulosa TaxID=1464011 RepID=UPI00363F4CFB